MEILIQLVGPEVNEWLADQLEAAMQRGELIELRTGEDTHLAGMSLVQSIGE